MMRLSPSSVLFNFLLLSCAACGGAASDEGGGGAGGGDKSDQPTATAVATTGDDGGEPTATATPGTTITPVTIGTGTGTCDDDAGGEPTIACELDDDGGIIGCVISPEPDAGSGPPVVVLATDGG